MVWFPGTVMVPFPGTRKQMGEHQSFDNSLRDAKQSVAFSLHLFITITFIEK